MKRILILAIALFFVSGQVIAGDKKKKAPAVKGPRIDTTKITWMSWDEVQVAMKKEPRKIWVDIYTDWCGWCKVMDQKTFTNHDVIRYMNTKFYAVKFNAEKPEDIMLLGKMYKYNADNKINELAMQLMRGQPSYPTSVFMEENFQNPNPIPGYLPVSQIEAILKFLGDGIYKSQKWEDYQKTFTGTWKEAM